MLLTSSQVSIALSSSIVIFFTTALFLSGYAIQQRTLRDLRAAIRAPPQPEPKIFLPDRFKTSTTELADGTIIEVEDDGRALRSSSSSSSSNQKPLRGRARKQRQRQGQQQRGKNEEIIIEIKPTLPLPEEKAGGTNAKKPDQRAVKDTPPQAVREKHRAPSSTKSSEKKQPQPQPNGKQQQQQVKGAKPQDKGKKDQKEEKVVLPGPDAVPHPEDEGKLVSRAERRRLIKEELQRLSRGSERVYWQRRLW
ncbi:hypothetical protein V8F33_008398 [Rhypophila sp. PSN 637]